MHRIVLIYVLCIKFIQKFIFAVVDHFLLLGCVILVGNKVLIIFIVLNGGTLGNGLRGDNLSHMLCVMIH